MVPAVPELPPTDDAPAPPPVPALVPPPPPTELVPAVPAPLLPAVPVEPLAPGCPALEAEPAEPGFEPVSFPEEQAATETNATQARCNVLLMMSNLETYRDQRNAERQRQSHIALGTGGSR
jgi:hypothetical protein